MKRALLIFWLICCAVVIAAYLAACLSPYIPPSSVSVLSLFGLVFPFLFVAAIFCCFTIFFIKKGAAMLLCVILILAGYTNLGHTIALHPGKWQMQKDSSTLRIMTWNVEGFLNFYPLTDSLSTPRKNMYNLIKQYNPDVLCVQEFQDIEGPGYPSFRKELAGLGYRYMYISNDSIDNIGGRNTGYSGTAILLRTTAIDSGRINIRKIYRNENVVYSDVMFNNRRLRFFAGHLASLNLYIDTLTEPPTHDNIYETTYKKKRKIEYMYRKGELTHEQQVITIRNILNTSPYPAIYCGDNNAPPTSYTYNRLKGNLQDAFLKKGFGLGGTFYKISPTLRIDVCFVNNQCYIKQCTVPQAQLSDHYPVVTDIGWKSNAP